MASSKEAKYFSFQKGKYIADFSASILYQKVIRNMKFFILLVSFLFVSCQNKSPFNLVQIEKASDISKLNRFNYLKRLKEYSELYDFPVRLELYYNKSEEYEDQYWLEKRNNFIPIHFSPSLEVYDDSTEKIIIYEFSDLGKNHKKSLCYFNRTVRDSFCIHTRNDIIEFQSYKNNLRDGVCIIKSKETTVMGHYEGITDGIEPNEMDVDTFNSFDLTKYEEKVFIQRLGGKSFKVGEWRKIVETSGEIEIVNYN